MNLPMYTTLSLHARMCGGSERTSSLAKRMGEAGISTSCIPPWQEGTERENPYLDATGPGLKPAPTTFRTEEVMEALRRYLHH